MSPKIHFFYSNLEFFPENGDAVSDENENVSIKTFLQLRRDDKGNGTVLCSPTTAGLWQGMPIPRNTSDRQNERKGEKIILFVLNNDHA